MGSDSQARISPPAELVFLPQWVAWALVKDPEAFRYPNGSKPQRELKPKENGKPNKLPIDPKRAGPAKTNSPTTWGTFAEATQAAKRHKLAGVGFVFSESDPFAGVDLDDCRDPKTGALEPWAEKIIQSLNSYTEVSPSLTGVKIWVRGKLPPGGRQKSLANGKVEMFDKERYFTFTGLHLAGSPKSIEARQAELVSLHGEMFTSAPVQTARAAIGADSALSDEEIIDKANSAKNAPKFKCLWAGELTGYKSQSEADIALCCCLAFWTKDEAQIDRLFRGSGLMRDKWNTADYRERTIAKAISQTPDTYKPAVSGSKHPRQQSKSASPQDGGIPNGFRLDRQHGVEFQTQGKNGQEPIWEHISPWIEVVAETSTIDESDDGILVRFVGHRGAMKEVVLPIASLFSSDGAECLSPLLSLGFRPRRAKFCIDRLKDYLYYCRPRSCVTVTSRIGWHGKQFVLPDGPIGPAAETRVIYYGDQTCSGKHHLSGSIEDWREHVGRYCSGNSRLLFFTSCAFAAPLLTPLQMDGGGFHLYGTSSLGKTSTSVVAGSVWGGGPRNGFLETWRATANGMEAVAAQHNDCILPLDEISEVDPKEVSKIVYGISNGRGKARMRKDLMVRPGAEFRVLILSTGEKQQSDLMIEAGSKTKGGQETRLVPINSDAGNWGVFEDIHGFQEPASFVDHIRQTSKKYFGSPIRAFLEHVTCHLDQVTQDALANKEHFFKTQVKEDSSGEVRRVASRFAVVGFAGELATKLGITGWAKGEAWKAACICFDCWITGRGGVGAFEIEDGIEQLHSFLQTESSRFTTPGSTLTPQHHAGFQDDECYYVFPRVMTQEALKGRNANAVLKCMAERGLLKRHQSERGFGFKKKIGKRSDRFYAVIIDRFFQADTAEAELDGLTV
ncbi:MAG: DUF927 domain-containing protein [Bryobacteraceae bacterium]